MKVITDKILIKGNHTEICVAPVTPGDIPYSVSISELVSRTRQLLRNKFCSRQNYHFFMPVFYTSENPIGIYEPHYTIMNNAERSH